MSIFVVFIKPKIWPKNIVFYSHNYNVGDRAACSEGCFAPLITTYINNVNYF